MIILCFAIYAPVPHLELFWSVPIPRVWDEVYFTVLNKRNNRSKDRCRKGMGSYQRPEPTQIPQTERMTTGCPGNVDLLLACALFPPALSGKLGPRELRSMSKSYA